MCDSGVMGDEISILCISWELPFPFVEAMFVGFLCSFVCLSVTLISLSCHISFSPTDNIETPE